jgi:peptidoglycan hydrolase-like protein with peptidoglycan-binding domain
VTTATQDLTVAQVEEAEHAVAVAKGLRSALASREGRARAEESARKLLRTDATGDALDGLLEALIEENERIVEAGFDPSRHPRDRKGEFVHLTVSDVKIATHNDPGYAEVLRKDTNRRIGHLVKEEFGSTRGGKKWVAYSSVGAGRRQQVASEIGGAHEARQKVLQKLLDHVNEHERKRAEFVLGDVKGDPGDTSGAAGAAPADAVAKAAYDKGWKAGQDATPAKVAAADKRREHPHWYLGFFDREAGNEKYAGVARSRRDRIEEAGAALAMRGQRGRPPVATAAPPKGAQPSGAGGTEFEGKHPRGRGGKWIAKGQGLDQQGGDGRVKELQARLHELGFQTTQDGQFGVVTEEAVKAFQKKYGLEPTGKVDEATVETMRNPPKVDAATARRQIAAESGLQTKAATQAAKQALNDLGYEYDTPEDMARSLRMLQRQYGLDVSGKLDKRTQDLVARLQQREQRQRSKTQGKKAGLSADQLGEATTEEPEEGDMADVIHEAAGFDPSKHPRGRGGKFSEIAGRLATLHRQLGGASSHQQKLDRGEFDHATLDHMEQVAVHARRMNPEGSQHHQYVHDAARATDEVVHEARTHLVEQLPDGGSTKFGSHTVAKKNGRFHVKGPHIRSKEHATAAGVMHEVRSARGHQRATGGLREASYSSGGSDTNTPVRQSYGGTPNVVIPNSATMKMIGGQPEWVGVHLLADPDDRTPGMDDFFGNEPVQMPPLLREAVPYTFARCGTCVHHNGKRLCALYSAGTDRDDLCESWATLSPPSQVSAAMFYGRAVGQFVQEATTTTAEVLKVARARLEEAVEQTGGDELETLVKKFTDKGMPRSAAKKAAAKALARKRAQEALLGADSVEALLFVMTPTLSEEEWAALDQAAASMVEVEEARLSAEERKKLPKSAFAIPEKEAYPIHDESHARAALSMVAQHGTDEEKARVRAAVKRRHPKIAEAADSMAKATKHEKVGKTHQGLWHHKGLQLPAYIQHIANDLMEKRGKDESSAIAIALAAAKRWARGGGKVDAGTRAAAAKAVAEWEKLKATHGGKKLREALLDEVEPVVESRIPKLIERVAKYAHYDLDKPVAEAFHFAAVVAGKLGAAGDAEAAQAATAWAKLDMKVEESLELEPLTVTLDEARGVVEKVELHEAGYPVSLHFDPRLHPRGRTGQFTDVLSKLRGGTHGSEVTLPHGVAVRRSRAGRGLSVSQGGKHLGTFTNPGKAAERALAATGIPERSSGGHMMTRSPTHSVAFDPGDRSKLDNKGLVSHAFSGPSSVRVKNMRTEPGKSPNSSTIFSYDEPLAHIDHSERVVHLNVHKYSTTTSGHRNLVRSEAERRGYSVREIDRAEARSRANMTATAPFTKLPAGVKPAPTRTEQVSAQRAAARERVTGESRGERGRIVPGSSGGFLQPPGHPDTKFAIETDLRRRPENRSRARISSALEPDSSFDAATREQAAKLMRDYKANQPPLSHPAVQEWVRSTLGYYNRGYGGHPELGEKRWHAGNLVFDDRDPVLNADEHAGVRSIRQHYPDFKPTAADFAPGGYGQKASSVWHADVESLSGLHDKLRNSDLVTMSDKPGVTIHRIKGEGLWRNATHVVRQGDRQKIAYSAEQAAKWARGEDNGLDFNKGAAMNWRTGQHYFNGEPTTNRESDKFEYTGDSGVKGDPGSGTGLSEREKNTLADQVATESRKAGSPINAYHARAEVDAYIAQGRDPRDLLAHYSGKAGEAFTASRREALARGELGNTKAGRKLAQARAVLKQHPGDTEYAGGMSPAAAYRSVIDATGRPPSRDEVHPQLHYLLGSGVKGDPGSINFDPSGLGADVADRHELMHQHGYNEAAMGKMRSSQNHWYGRGYSQYLDERMHAGEAQARLSEPEKWSHLPPTPPVARAMAELQRGPGGVKAGGETRYGTGTTARFSPARQQTPPGSAEEFAKIGPGDRVTILTPHGQERSGRVVMRGPAGWVLNLGGAHGTPGIAHEGNVVKVRKQRKLREIAADVVAALPVLNADTNVITLLKTEEAWAARLPLAETLVRHGGKLPSALRDELREALETAAPKDDCQKRLAEARAEGDRAKVTLYSTLIEALG